MDVELGERDGEIVDLGEISSHLISDNSFSIEAQPDNQYGIFCAGRNSKGEGAAFVSNRFVTTSSEQPRDTDYLNELMNSGYTLDELQFTACVALGLTKQQAEGVRVRLGRRLVDSDFGRKMLVASFNLELKKSGPEHELGVMVGPDADFTLFQYYSAKKTRQLAGIKV